MISSKNIYQYNTYYHIPYGFIQKSRMIINTSYMHTFLYKCRKFTYKFITYLSAMSFPIKKVSPSSNRLGKYYRWCNQIRYFYKVLVFTEGIYIHGCKAQYNSTMYCKTSLPYIKYINRIIHVIPKLKYNIIKPCSYYSKWESY